MHGAGFQWAKVDYINSLIAALLERFIACGGSNGGTYDLGGFGALNTTDGGWRKEVDPYQTTPLADGWVRLGETGNYITSPAAYAAGDNLQKTAMLGGYRTLSANSPLAPFNGWLGWPQSWPACNFSAIQALLDLLAWVYIDPDLSSTDICNLMKLARLPELFLTYPEYIYLDADGTTSITVPYTTKLHARAGCESADGWTRKWHRNFNYFTDTADANGNTITDGMVAYCRNGNPYNEVSGTLYKRVSGAWVITSHPTDTADVLTGTGYIQCGDIIGSWIFNEIESALAVFKYTYKGCRPWNYGGSGGPGGAYWSWTGSIPSYSGESGNLENYKDGSGNDILGNGSVHLNYGGYPNFGPTLADMHTSFAASYATDKAQVAAGNSGAVGFESWQSFPNCICWAQKMYSQGGPYYGTLYNGTVFSDYGYMGVWSLDPTIQKTVHYYACDITYPYGASPLSFTYDSHGTGLSRWTCQLLNSYNIGYAHSDYHQFIDSTMPNVPSTCPGLNGFLAALFQVIEWQFVNYT